MCGLGLGGSLCNACIAFTRNAGYKMVMLTNSGLQAERAIYLKRGFKVVKSETHQGFGQDLAGETWEPRL